MNTCAVHPELLRYLFCGPPVLHVKIHLSCTPYGAQAVTTTLDKHISIPASSVYPPTAPLSDIYCPPRLAFELLWAMPWQQAIFEVALSGRSCSQLFSKKGAEGNHQPVVNWPPPPRLFQRITIYSFTSLFIHCWILLQIPKPKKNTGPFVMCNMSMYV